MGKMKYSLARFSDIRAWSLIGSSGVLAGFALLVRFGSREVHPSLAPIAFCLLVGGVIGAAIPLVFSIPCHVRVSEDAARAFEGMLQRAQFEIVLNERDLVVYRAKDGGVLKRLTAFTNTVVIDRSSMPVRLRLSWYYRFLVWSRLGIRKL